MQTKFLSLYPTITRGYELIVSPKFGYGKIIEYLKVGVLAGLLLFSVVCYLYFVNQSSTMGFYFRGEQTALDAAKFDHNVSTVAVMEKTKSLRSDVISRDDATNTVTMSNIVQIPLQKEFTYRE